MDVSENAHPGFSRSFDFIPSDNRQHTIVYAYADREVSHRSVTLKTKTYDPERAMWHEKDVVKHELDNHEGTAYRRAFLSNAGSLVTIREFQEDRKQRYGIVECHNTRLGQPKLVGEYQIGGFQLLDDGSILVSEARGTYDYGMRLAILSAEKIDEVCGQVM